MNDLLKGKFFRDLMGIDSFKAQLLLEDELYNNLLTRIASIDLSRADLQLEYAKLRGSLDILKSMKAARDRLAEDARVRERNS